MMGSSTDVLRAMREILNPLNLMVEMTRCFFFLPFFVGVGNVICTVSRFIKWAIKQDPSNLSSSCCQIFGLTWLITMARLMFNMAWLYSSISGINVISLKKYSQDDEADEVRGV